jgi:hypothetical protein
MKPLDNKVTPTISTYYTVKPDEHKNFTRFLNAIRELPLPACTWETFYLQHNKQCPLNSGSADCQCSPGMFQENPDGSLQAFPNGNPPELPLAYQSILSPEIETSPEAKTLIEITPRLDESGKAYRQVLVMRSSYVPELHSQKIRVFIRPGMTPEELVKEAARLRAKMLSDYDISLH